ncbi:hypothetical protein ACFQHV_04220 [Promicromonospora thailandica]|uniref:Uncharacterized protein n=1 Tax=Promicromonospora thailandica TaxID=765201 RepID=A0A9X2GAS0_9MICO|nr:hypothetical protein [Promicromonospora thailandica]MCP2265736.1 hypothetical protein [Promicromonospora thailandica]
MSTEKTSPAPAGRPADDAPASAPGTPSEATSRAGSDTRPDTRPDTMLDAVLGAVPDDRLEGPGEESDEVPPHGSADDQGDRSAPLPEETSAGVPADIPADLSGHVTGDAPSGAAGGATETTVEAPDNPAGTAVVPAPAARPLTAALLNLSGLGLGYLHLRAWVRLVVALAATSGLVWVALPIGREPIAVWWALGYLGALLLFAVDGALLARRRVRRVAEPTPPRTVWSPRAARRVAWATLAVVPLLATAYVVTQNEVLEQYLAHDLVQAQEDLDAAGTVFPPYEKLYDNAYATYVRTTTEHPGSRAAERVPGLVEDLYDQAKGTGPCNAVAAVRHFAEDGVAGPLRATAQDELPKALSECGLLSTKQGVFATARPMLDELLAEHPTSDPAQELPGELAAWRDDVIAGLGRMGGCTDTRRAAESTAYLAGFDSAEVSALADKARAKVPAGLVKCAVRMFEGEQHTTALTNLDAVADSYPRSDQAEYAERLAIAVGIASVDPDAGVKLPARDEPDGTVTITYYNYSPEPFELVYSGPATGSVQIDACDDCEPVTRDGDAPVCSGYSLTHPSTTVTLPAGTYLTATRHDGVVAGWYEEGVTKETFTASGSFCTWTYER